MTNKNEENSVFETIAYRYALSLVSIICSLSFIVILLFYAAIAARALIPEQDWLQQNVQELKPLLVNQDAQAVSHYFKTRADVNSQYLMLDAQNKRLAGNLSIWPNNTKSLGKWKYFTLGNDSESAQSYLGLVSQHESGRYLVSRNITDIVQPFKTALSVLGLFLLLSTCFGVLGAIYVAFDMRKRINSINKSLYLIMQGDLSQRMKILDSDGEFGELIGNANTMFDRIEELVAGIRQVSNNIAHDLRTPLTRLRNQLTELQWHASEDNVDIVKNLIGEADDLLVTFNALLRIAQIEAGKSRENFKVLDLASILSDVVEFYEPLAQEKDIEIEQNLNSVNMLGDRDLLFQMLVNVLDNAIKYSSEGGQITLSCLQVGYYIVLEISDRGPGIPLELHNKVFNRFYRVEESRGLKPGNGLGLSLVSAIVDQHNGRVNLHDNKPGLRVEFVFNNNLTQNRIGQEIGQEAVEDAT